jgi:hypothetical protein
MFMLIPSISLVEMQIDNSEDLAEALLEFDCTFVTLKEEGGLDQFYLVSDKIKSLAQCVLTCDIPGNIVEFSHIWDSTERETILESEK